MHSEMRLSSKSMSCRWLLDIVPISKVPLSRLCFITLSSLLKSAINQSFHRMKYLGRLLYVISIDITIFFQYRFLDISKIKCHTTATKNQAGTHTVCKLDRLKRLGGTCPRSCVRSIILSYNVNGLFQD